jgi:hypothetical protein
MESCTITNTNDLFFLCSWLDTVCAKQMRDDIWTCTLKIKKGRALSYQSQVPVECTPSFLSVLRTC